ncbi:MAG: class IV adenylate cyclase [Pirellula sp.]|jgi:adenylate cyclase class 2
MTASNSLPSDQAFPKDNSFPMEIEGKYRVADEEHLRGRLREAHAEVLGAESHCDTYLRHPSRDFRVTDEALRLRNLNGNLFVTYKGPRLEGALKMRPELEVPLAQETFEPWLRIWKSLGFEVVATVKKTRESFRVAAIHSAVTVTIDRVAGIGTFAEVERVVDNEQELVAARQDIEAIATRLGLDTVEKQSYLSMFLEQNR